MTQLFFVISGHIYKQSIKMHVEIRAGHESRATAYLPLPQRLNHRWRAI